METIVSTDIQVSSPAFGNLEEIPEKYTCDADNINPPLIISNLPSGTRSLALIMDDPDAIRGTFVHWLAWNIPPTESIPEGLSKATEGTNSSEKKGYMGPCPPSGTHHYHFKVYALDQTLSLEAGAVEEMLTAAMEHHILGTGVLIGLYTREGY